MAQTRYRRTSPYAETSQTSWYLRQLNLRNVPPDDTDIPMEVQSKYDERPDLLSNDLYGTPDYWWVFIVRNMEEIKDPIHDLKPGLEIFVPTKERLQELFE